MIGCPGCKYDGRIHPPCEQYGCYKENMRDMGYSWEEIEEHEPNHTCEICGGKYYREGLCQKCWQKYHSI